MQGDLLKVISKENLSKKNIINKKDTKISNRNKNNDFTFKDAVNEASKSKEVKKTDNLYENKYNKEIEDTDEDKDLIEDDKKYEDDILKFLLMFINENKFDSNNKDDEKLQKVNNLLKSLLKENIDLDINQALNNKNKSNESKDLINTLFTRDLSEFLKGQENAIDFNALNGEIGSSKNYLIDLLDKKIQSIKENLMLNGNSDKLNSKNIKTNLILELFSDKEINNIKQLINSFKNENSDSLNNNSSKNLFNLIIKKLKESDDFKTNENKNNLNNIEQIKKHSNKLKTVLENNSNLKDSKENSSKEFKEDDFLNEVIGKNNKNQFNHRIGFMQNLNNVSFNQNIEDVGTINIKENPVEGIIKTIKFMDKEGIKELTVKINPKELGEMTVKLTMTASSMKATIEATSKETYKILQANLNELKNSLHNENIKIEELNINLYNDDPSFYRNSSNESGFNNSFLNNNNSNRENKESHNRINILNDNVEVKETTTDDGIVNMFA
ncbi:flagellar hook-length control protein FliK [Clostridium fallax]|uniref:Flagellar hook-length control protein FliK n=1 Tax=Clostridium fallax TaxID=1533 RepID=A0A1M4UJK7_9CLOT|nr:flagellar hook-length control protein FliK [Clostridium fallax]SHE56926.1 flagellar hook-length control protein FliK [Clostridium fallax]SQB07602.1 flagellar hook-length control protein [Clostridium fallax]